MTGYKIKIKKNEARKQFWFVLLIAEQYQHERQFNPFRETQFQTPQNHHQQFESAPRQQSLSVAEVPVHQHSAQLPDVHQAQQYQRQLSDLEDDGSNVYEAEPGRPHHLYQAVHKHDGVPRQQQAGLQARAQEQFQPRGEPIYQRPMSFKDKVRQASFNNQVTFTKYQERILHA